MVVDLVKLLDFLVVDVDIVYLLCVLEVVVECVVVILDSDLWCKLFVNCDNWVFVVND